MDIQLNNEHQIRHLIREVILHHHQNHQGFLQVTDSLDSVLGSRFVESNFTRAVCHWFDTELSIMKARPRAPEEKRTICFAFVVWGEEYVKNLTKCCLSSLLAEGNIPELVKERNVVFLIHTDRKSEALLLQSPVTKKLQEYGVKFEFLFLPGNLIGDSSANPNNKYWLLGASQTIQILIAKQLGADFHVSAPDIIYSENFFKNMLKKVNSGAKNILQAVLSRIDRDKLFSDLNISDFPIAIPAAKLCASALNNAAPATQRLIINNRQDIKHWPVFHLLFWEGKELHSVCQHCHPVYLDREIVANIPERYHATLDSELDRIIPEEVELHHIKSEDDMIAIEVTSPADGDGEPYTDINGYIHYFWMRTGRKKPLRYFMCESTFPIDASVRKCVNQMTDEEIKESQNVVQVSVESSCPFEQ